MEFFGRTGRAICFSPDGDHLYLWNGRPVGHFNSGRVYSFGGKLLGWSENGWLYDRRNRPALFSAEATGGPVKPVRHVKPVKGVRAVRPVKGVRQVAPARPAKSSSWSEFAGANYFDQ
jgi:hypothetical protein